MPAEVKTLWLVLHTCYGACSAYRKRFIMGLREEHFLYKVMRDKLSGVLLGASTANAGLSPTPNKWNNGPWIYWAINISA